MAAVDPTKVRMDCPPPGNMVLVAFVFCVGAFVCRSCRMAETVHKAFAPRTDNAPQCASTYAALCAAALATQGLALVAFFVSMRNCDPWPGFLLFILVTVASGFAVDGVQPYPEGGNKNQ